MAQPNLEKHWEKAGLTDDFIFNKVFLDPIITKEMIHRVLPELSLGKVSARTNEHVRFEGCRFGIYAEDEHRNHYEVESRSSTKACCNERAPVKLSK